jgi:folate-dependent phosphoribosylglycinamide formyltransferase PurN
MSFNDIVTLVKSISIKEVLAVYAVVKVYFATARAWAAKKAAKAEAEAYVLAHKAEADAKSAEVKVKSFLEYLWSEIKAGL